MDSLKRLLHYARSFRKDITLATIYSVLNKLFDIMPEVLIGVAVDIIVRKKESYLARLGIEDVFTQLLVLAGVILFAFASESVLQFLFQVKWRNLAQALQHSMRMDCYNHVQKLDVSFFEDKSTGNLLSIMNDDINQLERFLDGGANALIQVVSSTVLIGIIFLFISPSVALIALFPMPLILYGAYKFQYLLGPRYALVRQNAGDIGARLSNNLLGMATIRSYSAEDFESERLKKDSFNYQSANQKAITLSSAYIPIIRMAIVAGFIATLILGGYYALKGDLEVASYSVLVFLTQRLLWPFTRLAEMTDLYQRAMASADRVLDLLQTKISIKDGQQDLPSVNGVIDFKEVNFGYDNQTMVIKNFSLTIAKGQTLALVGVTGAGKTTLVKLLLRFYSPTSGKILIDGHDIASVKLRDLRNALSFVSQDVFLFPGTIAENIAYAQPQADINAIMEAAKIAEAHDFIMSLPKGYDTEVGERGIKLSGGQKQRLSIARAVLKNAPIFILDEATSSVDNETEEAIQKSLNKIMGNKTTIVIAHRLSTIRHASIICVVGQGEIKEIGTHEQLCQNNGIYARLWKIQTGDLATIGHII